MEFQPAERDMATHSNAASNMLTEKICKQNGTALFLNTVGFKRNAPDYKGKVSGHFIVPSFQSKRQSKRAWDKHLLHRTNVLFVRCMQHDHDRANDT
jgi:hypothetical protein